MSTPMAPSAARRPVAPLLFSLLLAAAPAASSCRRAEPLPPPAAPAPAPAPAAAAAPAAAPAAAAASSARVKVQVTEAGFVPEKIPAQVGKPITLAITRTTDKTCARDVLFTGVEGKTALPLNREVEVSYTPKAAGEVRFGCAMGMMVAGVLDVK